MYQPTRTNIATIAVYVVRVQDKRGNVRRSTIIIPLHIMYERIFSARRFRTESVWGLRSRLVRRATWSCSSDTTMRAANVGGGGEGGKGEEQPRNGYTRKKKTCPLRYRDELTSIIRFWT